MIEVNKTNRAAVDKAVKALQNELEKKWTTIVSVPEEKEHVGIYAMSDPAGESTTGLAIWSSTVRMQSLAILSAVFRLAS